MHTYRLDSFQHLQHFSSTFYGGPSIYSTRLHFVSAFGLLICSVQEQLFVEKMKLVFVHIFHHVSESFEKTETLFCALSDCRFYGTVCIHVWVKLAQRRTRVTFRIDMSFNMKPIYNKSSILKQDCRPFIPFLSQVL